MTIISNTNETLDPFGGYEASIIKNSNVNAIHYLSYAYTSGIGVTTPYAIHTSSYFIKKKLNRYVKIYAVGSGSAAATFDLDASNFTSYGGSIFKTCNAEYYGNGWYRLSITYASTTSINFNSGIYTSPNDINPATAATAFDDGGLEGCYVYGCQINYGAKALPYQSITTATSYDTDVTKFPYYASFDGVSQYLKSNPYTLNQPTTVMMLYRPIGGVSGRYVIDGNTEDKGAIVQSAAVGNISQNAGTAVNNTTKTNIGTLDVITATYNGAGSFTKINSLSKVIGNSGTGNMGGFTLGAKGDNTLPSNIHVYDIVISRNALSDIDVAQITGYWKSKYGAFIDW